jgi:hypothetical protein
VLLLMSGVGHYCTYCAYYHGYLLQFLLIKISGGCIDIFSGDGFRV